MSHDWKPEEWREMGGRDVLSCLADDYEAEYEIDGVPWLRLIPNAVLAEALCNVDIYHQYSVCEEAARRLPQLDVLKDLLGEELAPTQEVANTILSTALMIALKKANERLSRELHDLAIKLGAAAAEIARLERRFLEETRAHDKTRHVLECRERELERIRSNMYSQRVEEWTEVTEKEFDYACAEEFFATRRAPRIICVEGRQLVVTEWLLNPSLNADEDDLPREN